MDKKTLIIFRWAPPAPGGPQNYVILTNYSNIYRKGQPLGKSLPCKYYYYDKFWPENLRPSASGFILGRLALTWHRIKQTFWMLRGGIRLIKREKIKLIFAVSDGGHSFLYAFTLSILTGTPYVVFLFDIFKENNLARNWKLFAKIFEPMLFRFAKLLIVTNQGTKDFYDKRGGHRLSIQVIYNSTFPEPYQKLHTPFNPQPPYKIFFTGNLYWAQETSVRNLIRAVRTINNMSLELHFYILNPPENFVEDFKDVKNLFIKTGSPQEMPEIQSQADILFLPLAWNTPSPDIINTATPGKLTDYLIAGRPILIHAPRSAFLVHYARENGFAHIVDEENTELLAQGIRTLLTDIPYSRTLVENAEKTFFMNHHAQKNVELLVAILNQLE